jgi:hypothetical protein
MGLTEATPLPELLDCAKLARELGVSRAAAEAIMRQLPKQHVPDLKKVYVRRAHVLELLDEHQRAA